MIDDLHLLSSNAIIAGEAQHVTNSIFTRSRIISFLIKRNNRQKNSKPIITTLPTIHRYDLVSLHFIFYLLDLNITQILLG